LWFDTSNPQLYIWYVDPTSSQWVIATAYAGGLTSDAPSDGQVYGRQNGAWQNFAPDGPYLPLSGGTVTGHVTTPDVVSVADYFAPGRVAGTTDDLPAWNAAVAKAVSLGGATITAPTGTISLITGNIVVSSSGIRFHLPNVTLKLSGSTITRGISFEGTTTTGPVLSADVAAYATTLTVSALNGITAGGYISLRWTAAVPSGLTANYGFVAMVRTITGTGPYTLQLNSPVPTAILTTDVNLVSYTVAPLMDVGVSGGVTIDGTAVTGTTCHGIYAINCVKSVFRDIKAVNIVTGSIVFGFTGHNNLFENINGVNCGNDSFAAFYVTNQTMSQTNNLRMEQSFGFGLLHNACTYCTGTGHIAEACVGSGRGSKYQACLFNNFSNIQSHFNHSNGCAVAVASCFNTFTGVAANSNLALEGVWLSDQNNCNNTFVGINAYGNATRDLYIGASDLNNQFYSVNAGIIEDHAPNSTFFTAGMAAVTHFPLITVDGSSTFGTNAGGTLNVDFNSAAGNARTLRFNTASSQRWTIVANATAETGANLGSDFIIGRWADNGTSLGTAFTINRNTGNVTIASALRVNGTIGFNNTAPVAKPTVSGAKGSNAALGSLLTALAAYGLVTDSTTA
jgi:hypothetical protein